MAVIEVTTIIHNTAQIVFDLSRSIDLHKLSTKHTYEEAVEGTTTRLISKDETVTWRAKHLFTYRAFTSKITAFNSPLYFKDEMQKGDFKTFSHEHSFNKAEGLTVMKDKIFLEAPYAFIGKIVMHLFLKNYIKAFLIDRNALIKEFAETGRWKSILHYE